MPSMPLYIKRIVHAKLCVLYLTGTFYTMYMYIEFPKMCITDSAGEHYSASQTQVILFTMLTLNVPIMYTLDH